MHQTRRVTLQDVADRAGVSLTTASRVVNEGARRVGPHLADRVNLAVAELGYTANLQARAVATGQSTMVGVVVHDIADPYFSSIAAGLIEVAEARGLLVCISSTAAAEAAEREYVALMRAQRARAVILIGSRSDDLAGRDALRAEIAAFTRGGGRAVAVGQDLLGVDTVLPENAAGADALARAMVALGHRRFAVLAGPRGLLTARDRLDGFRAGLAAWGVPPGGVRVVHGAFTRDGGYEAMSALMSASEPLPDCVFAVTDVMAMGALARLRAGGLAVPADIALAGFDDIGTLRDVYPPLTTVRLPLKRMGETAAGLILAEPATGNTTGNTTGNATEPDRDPEPRVIPVPGEVILRESTLPHPPAL
ncbi:MAG TPA: LacI family DNA-binding transcriptional regulator [Streptosporangiaceae bacterium]